MNWRHDKFLHFAAGLLVAAVTSLVCGHPGIGLALAVAAGIGKEAWDYRKNAEAEDEGRPAPHSVETADLFFTIAGGLAGELAGALLSPLMALN